MQVSRGGVDKMEKELCQPPNVLLLLDSSRFACRISYLCLVKRSLTTSLGWGHSAVSALKRAPLIPPDIFIVQGDTVES